MTEHTRWQCPQLTTSGASGAAEAGSMMGSLLLAQCGHFAFMGSRVSQHSSGRTRVQHASSSRSGILLRRDSSNRSKSSAPKAWGDG